MLNSENAKKGNKVIVVMGYYEGRKGVIANVDITGVLVTLTDEKRNPADVEKGTRINFGRLELDYVEK